MKIRAHTLSVLIRKDFKLMFSNKNVMIMVLMPILFALFYEFIFSDNKMSDMDHGGTNFVLLLTALVNMSAMPLSALSMMVAEEKEKNTLRVLMLSDVKGSEYIISKVFTTLCIMIGISVIIFYVTGSSTEFILPYLFVTFLTSLSILLFGAVIGLISKDQMSTGTLSTPVMVLFLMPPMFAGANKALEVIANCVPTTAMVKLFDTIFAGKSIVDASMLGNYGMIGIWIVIGVGVFLYMYKRKGFDN